MEKVINKVCPRHGLTEFFYSESEHKYRCKECRKEAVLEQRRRNKIVLVEYKGGKCEICGYDKCIDVLEFHHVDPSTKSFTIGNGDIRSLSKLKEEADKCIMVCSNCHKEIHAKIRHEKELERLSKIEENSKLFSETSEKHIYNIPTEKDLVKIREYIEQGCNSTKIANTMNFALTTFKRFLKKNNIVNPNNGLKLSDYTVEQLKTDLKELDNFSAIGRKYGFTYTALKKWCGRNNLPIHLNELKEFLNINH